VKVTLDIRPRAAFRAYLERVQRWACLVVHRRAGKTYACIQDLIFRATTHKRKGPPLRYAYVGPTRDQAKDIAWPYLKRFLAPVPGVKVNEADLSVTLPNGAMIRLYSGDSYERMRGLYFDGVVIDESADIDPLAWTSVIRPTLSDYNGWATFIGTPKGRNAFYRTHRHACGDEAWYSLVLRASESGIIPQDELDDIRKSTPDDIYRQEYECDFSVGMPGAVYARFIGEMMEEERIKDFPWDRAQPVWTSWDLGSPKNTVCIYWQFVGREIHIIDHDSDLEFSPVSRVAHMNGKGYPYAGHLFPHDAAAQEKSGKNFQQQMSEAELYGIRIVPRCQDIWPGINKAAEFFPRMLIHKTRCARLVDALESYHTRHERGGDHVTSVPVHDWSSHHADAFRVMGEGMLNGMLKGHSEAIRDHRPQHLRQRTASAGRYQPL